jgi:hypothetical protein
LPETQKIDSMETAVYLKPKSQNEDRALPRNPNHRHHENRALPETQTIGAIAIALWLKPKL